MVGWCWCMKCEDEVVVLQKRMHPLRGYTAKGNELIIRRVRVNLLSLSL